MSIDDFEDDIDLNDLLPFDDLRSHKGKLTKAANSGSVVIAVERRNGLVPL